MCPVLVCYVSELSSNKYWAWCWIIHRKKLKNKLIHCVLYGIGMILNLSVVMTLWLNCSRDCAFGHVEEAVWGGNGIHSTSEAQCKKWSGLLVQWLAGTIEPCVICVDEMNSSSQHLDKLLNVVCVERTYRIEQGPSIDSMPELNSTRPDPVMRPSLHPTDDERSMMKDRIQLNTDPVTPNEMNSQTR